MTAIEYLENKIIFLENKLNECRDNDKVIISAKEVIKVDVSKIEDLDRFRLLTDQNYRIYSALQLNNNSRVKTAKYLGISERTVYRFIEKNNHE